MNRKKPEGYLSYLLRLWPTSDQGGKVWRASLEQPGSRHLQGFSNLQALFDFLLAQTGQDEPKEESEP